MNTLDIIILVLVLIPTLLGLRKGLLKSIFSLAGIITGLFLATKYYDKTGSYLAFLKADPKLISLISFILILVLSYFALTYIAGKISGINAVTKTFDKIAGVALGLLKGLIIASLFLLMTTNTFKIFDDNITKDSKFYSIVKDIAPDTYNLILKLFPNAKDFYEELNKKLFTSY
ncbi:MAG TPA: CvpA family protein [Ignavibacteria bacterium]|nr:CvpA family protein [Ignavibacteria bacterium]HMR40183.1 CvpA family protein [Ignavibacteria bacterium]